MQCEYNAVCVACCLASRLPRRVQCGWGLIDDSWLLTQFQLLPVNDGLIDPNWDALRNRNLLVDLSRSSFPEGAKYSCCASWVFLQNNSEDLLILCEETDTAWSGHIFHRTALRCAHQSVYHRRPLLIKKSVIAVKFGHQLLLWLGICWLFCAIKISGKTEVFYFRQLILLTVVGSFGFIGATTLVYSRISVQNFFKM